MASSDQATELGAKSRNGEVIDPHESSTNVKETIESILVAFILAFVFRAFVVEAFVIPTGSMAPTLLGAHMRFHCPDCGYQFDVNYRAPQTASPSDEPQITATARPDTDVYCPNCGYLVRSHKDDYPVQYGDRILVLKYVYLLADPKRWDVVVFKSPDNPETTNYTQNFIKRLVGLPGEKLMVLDGDLYVTKKENPETADWQIQTKPQQVQEALWRVIYDNDFYPQHSTRNPDRDWVQPWQQDAGAGWDTGNNPSTGRTFHFTNAGASGEIAFNPQANSTTHTLTDYLVYDTASVRGMLRQPGSAGSPDDEAANAVSDLKLVAYYNRTAGDGAMRFKLTRHSDIDQTFTAELTPQTARLLRRESSGEKQIGPTIQLSAAGISSTAPIFVEMMNVDYQITLRLNGKTVLQSTPADYAPNVDWLLKQFKNQRRGRSGEVAIEADKQSCTLDHISLWRDVYYTNRQNAAEFPGASPAKPTQLGAGEYFMMGDNSAVSEDARYWYDGINLPHEGLKVDAHRVPEQFLLGKAVFVYWPAGYKAPGTPVSVIPNFGEMRWIH